MSEKSTFKLNTPIAIVIGAVIIGLAIVFTLNGKFSSQQTTSNSGQRPTIEEAAKKVGINQKALAKCIAEDRHRDVIEASMENAQAIGANGTPHSIIIGPNDNRIAASGALPIEYFQKVIEIMKEETPRSTTSFQTNESAAIFEFIMTEGVLPTISDDKTSLVALPESSVDHSRGSSDPVITIIEYSDIDCPFCARLHTTLQKLVAEDTDVQWIYRHLPIASLHPDAYTKALATECAYELSKQDDEVFAEYLDILIDAE